MQCCFAVAHLVSVIGDGVLELAEGVPQVDGAVARAGDDLAIVSRESDGQNVLGVADEAAGGDLRRLTQRTAHVGTHGSSHGVSYCEPAPGQAWESTHACPLNADLVEAYSACGVCGEVLTPVLRSHRRRVESQEPDRANCPSLEMATSCT